MESTVGIRAVGYFKTLDILLYRVKTELKLNTEAITMEMELLHRPEFIRLVHGLEGFTHQHPPFLGASHHFLIP